MGLGETTMIEGRNQVSRPGQQNPKPIPAESVPGLGASEGLEGTHPGDKQDAVCDLLYDGREREAAFLSVLSCLSLDECLSLKFRCFYHLPSDQELLEANVPASYLSPTCPEHLDSVWPCKVIQLHS